MSNLRYHYDDYERRRNSDNDPRDLQFHTPRGNIPARVARSEMQRGPPGQTKTRSTYPHVYRNDEGGPRTGVPAYHNFEDFEYNETRDGRLHEFPVSSGDPPGFSYNKKTSRREDLVPPENPRERTTWLKKQLSSVKPGKAGGDWIIPEGTPHKPIVPTKQWKQPNDVGYIRAVTTTDKKVVVGTLYHPVGNTNGFERAQIEPLDRKGRGDVRRYQDSQNQYMPQAGVWRKETWPPRGNDPTWDERQRR